MTNDDLEYNDDFEDSLDECPNCQHGYDDADFDFQICHHCGYDVSKGKVDQRRIDRSPNRYGIEPDVKLDDWF